MKKIIFRMKKLLTKSTLFFFLALLIYGSTGFYVYAENRENIKIERGNVLSYDASATEDVIYLSDIPYQKTQVG